MSIDSNMAITIGNFRGYHDASSGVFPSGDKADYWIVSFAGTLGAESYASGDLIMAKTNGASSSSGYFRIPSSEPVPAYLFDHTGPSVASYALRRLDVNYSGYAIRVRRASDDAVQDVGFGSDGLLDGSIVTSFLGVSDGYVSIWYDQIGSNDLSQATSANQPKLVQVSGVYTVLGTGGRWIGRNSFIGDQSASTISILWQAPHTQPGGFDQVQPGVAFGAGTAGFLSPWWSEGKGPYVFAGSPRPSEVEHNDGTAHLFTAQFTGNDYMGYFNGAECITPTVTLNDPPFDDVTLFKNDYGNGDLYIYELHIWDNDAVVAQTVFNNIKFTYPSLFPSRTDLFVATGDSITTSYYVDPNNSWPRLAFTDAGLDSWFAVCYGGWTLADIYAKKARINWYRENFAHTNSYVVIFAGTNDLLTESETTAFARLKDLAQDLKADGFTGIVVITCLPRHHTTNPGTSAAAAAFNTKRLAFNDAILADTSGDFAAVVDVELIDIGVNGEQDNTTYYNIDNVHLNYTGQQQLADHVSTTIQGLI